MVRYLPLEGTNPRLTKTGIYPVLITLTLNSRSNSPNSAAEISTLHRPAINLSSLDLNHRLCSVVDFAHTSSARLALLTSEISSSSRHSRRSLSLRRMLLQNNQ